MEYTNKIREAKKQSWIDFCNNTDSRNPWNSLYKCAADKLKTKQVLQTLQKQDGTHTGSMRETLKLLLDKFCPTDDPLDDEEEHQFKRELCNQPIATENDVPFTLLEIKKTLESFNAKKCPGEDGITSEVYMAVFNLLPQSLTTLYNECLRRGVFPNLWKKALIIPIVKPGKDDETDPSKYRPISLLPVAGKLLEKLLISRIMFFMESRSLIRDNQFGFRAQSSTTHCLVHVKQFISSHLHKRREVLLISLDIKSAFDSAWWPEILFQLRNHNCPQNLFTLTQSYFSNRTSKIKNGNLMLERENTRGCPQGSSCGPGYWIIMYDSILKLAFPLYVELVAYADDLLIMVAGKNIKDIELKGNIALSQISEWSKQTKIIFNSNKSLCLHITRKRNRTEPTICLNGKLIQCVSELKFLGVYFDSKYSWSCQIEKVCQRAVKLTNVLSKVARVHWGFPHGALKTIYSGAIIPVLTYASPVWEEALNQTKYKRKLRSAHRTILIRIIRGYRTISYEGACVIADIMPIELMVKLTSDIFKAKYFPTDLNVDSPISKTLWLHPSKHFSVIDQTLPDGITNCSYSFFTDGSKTEDKVGSAWVLYEDGVVTDSRKYRLSQNCSNNQAEAFAILNVLHMLSSILPTEEKTAEIFTDSMVTLLSLEDPRNHKPLVEQCKKLMDKLINVQGWRLDFRWVKGHSGVAGNEFADQLARKASTSRTLPISYSKKPFSHVLQQIEEQYNTRWDRDWQTTKNGSTTKKFFPSVKSRKRSKKLPITYKLTQLLSGHGSMKSYLHRFHIIDSPICDCAAGGSQTVDHLVYDCEKLENLRSVMIREVLLEGESWPMPLDVLIAPKFIQVFLNFVKNIDFTLLS